ncbi:MAG: efflux RND transporter periplasmic adaptor subunit [Nitrosomonadales bacterium]
MQSCRYGLIQPGINGYEAKLTLPGSLEGIYQGTALCPHQRVYQAMVQGYIGQPVKKGELLATLDIPRCQQAGRVSQQEYDEKAAAYQQTEAVLKRLHDEQDFGKVLAPFDGIVTKRNVDNGDLVNAGNGGTAQALFAIAQVDKLRLYAYVPQDRAARVRVGDTVDILRAEAADKPAKGQIVRTAGAIDPTTRTLQVEIQVVNTDHSLLPGSYVEVAFTLKSDGGLILPTNALLFSSAGSRVAIVQPDGKVRMQVVTLGTDFGHEVEIRKGLKAEDKVILNPPDSINDGQAVAIAPETVKGS